MNYDEARQLRDGGWRWTTMNDGIIRAAAPCMTILRQFDPGAPFKPLEDGDFSLCPPHPTREDAEQHFYDHCLAGLVQVEDEAAHRCAAGCGEWTNKCLENRGLYGIFRAIFLCNEHRTPEKVAELRPFEPGIQLIHS